MTPHYISSPTFWVIGIGCLLCTLMLLPLVMKLALRIGAVDHEGHRRVYKGDGMPLLGGLAIGIPFIAVCLLAFLGITNMFGTIQHHQRGLIALATGCLGIIILGVVDDKIGLNARAKFTFQVALALVVCFAGYVIREIYIPFFGRIHINDFLGVILTLVWIVGLTNAYNLIDGMDGLAAGLALIASVGLAFISLLNGSTLPALLCVALCGSLIPFLAYNFPPARIFLGDTGSMFLGFALANIALMGSLKTTGAVIFLAPILVLSLPILDTLISILRRFLRGRPIFTGDQGHLHHRLLKRGYSQRQSVLIFYLVAALMTGAAVLGWALPSQSPLQILTVGVYCLAVFALLRIAGLQWMMIARVMKCHRRNQLFNALSRYVTMRLNLASTQTRKEREEVLSFLCHELGLRFLEVEYEDGLRLRSAVAQTNLGESEQQAAIERLKVRVARKHDVILRFQPQQVLDEMAQTDIEACLATIFEHQQMSFLTTQLAPAPANAAALNNQTLPYSYAAQGDSAAVETGPNSKAPMSGRPF